MIQEETYDVAVIGAGAAGLAAAAETAGAGRSTVVIDREALPGGILRQCIHNGFGLNYFKEELTGPEYATRITRIAREAGAVFALNCAVTDVKRLPDKRFELIALSPEQGVLKYVVRAVILAMGCRERNRGNLAVPGTRPAGIYTAGSAQKLLNRDGALPGTSAVIVGSGDIGLIMARRLRWCGIEVKAVIEIMPQPSGLPRNIAQCLDDFGIPLYLKHAVTNIGGAKRVEYVDVAPLADGIPDASKTFRIQCDTLLFSVGLVPENELSRQLGVELNPATGGARVDSGFQTSVPGVFAGGNVLHVHDLVDFVSEEAALAAKAALRYLDGAPPPERSRVRVESNLKYVVPGYFGRGLNTVFSFRPLITADAAQLTARLDGEIVWKRRLRSIRPAEMIKVELPGTLLNCSGELVFSLETELEA